MGKKKEEKKDRIYPSPKVTKKKEKMVTKAGKDAKTHMVIGTEKKVIAISKDLLDENDPTALVSTIRLEKIELKDMQWFVRLRVGMRLPRSYDLYKILMELDEQPYEDRIEELEAQVRGTLFENDKSQVKQLDERIASVRKDLAEKKKECEVMKFSATVIELKYKDNDTVIVVRVPDDIIESFNRQKTRLSYYKITLESIYA